MIIRRARTMGFCFGVKNTVRLANELVSSHSGPIYSLGEIVHNEALVKEYSKKGLKVIAPEDDVPVGRVLIRAHGVTPDVEESLRRRGFEIIDGTCPLVKKNQLACQASTLPVILFCKHGHDEAVGIAGHARCGCICIEREEDLDDVTPGEYTVLVQTTFSSEKLERFLWLLKAKGCTFTIQGSGICPASRQRRAAVEELARSVEAIVVVGDENSANSTALYNLASSLLPGRAFFVSGPDRVTGEMASFPSVGITAGASVADDLISEVEERLGMLSLDDN